MTESLISHWTDAQCREVLDQLLAEEKGRITSMHKSYLSGDYTAMLSFVSDHRLREFAVKEEAQAWLDQQWKDYVERMKP